MVEPIEGLHVRKQKNIDGKEVRLFLYRFCRKSRKSAVFQRMREVFARWRNVCVSVLQSGDGTEGRNTTTLDLSVALRPQDDEGAANVILSGAKDPVGRVPPAFLKHYFRPSHSQNSGSGGSNVFQSGDGTEGRNTITLDPSVALRPQDDEGAANVILSGAKDPVEGFPLAFPHLSVLWRYLRLFFGYQRPPHYLLHSSSRGAILIMVACFLPIILLGIKYSEKLFQSKEHNITKSEDNKVVKVCAQEAALEVARNWNPGLTLAQQQEAVYKVADAVYNAYPCYYNSVLGHALPGVMAYDNSGNLISSDASRKQVSYNTSAKHRYMYHTEKWTPTSWYGRYVLWLAIDKMSDPSKRVSIFDEVQQDGGNFSLLHQDLFIEPHTLTVVNDIDQTTVYYTPTSNASGVGNYSFADTLIDSGYTASISIKAGLSKSSFSSQGAADLPDENHTVRVAPSAGGDLVVKVEVANDRIKATTDDQSGYAVPAECNVDIVLAVPTNGAACNVNNRDMASDTAESCFVSTSTVDNGRIWVLPTTVASGKQSPKDTPIYQMGQALKTFVKSHFYHTRGVNMALIPYSAKVSVSPDRATDWTVAFPAFVDTSANTQLMIGACLYGTSGVKGDALKQSAKTASRMSGDALRTTDTPYYWGDIITACPIMFRAGAQQTETKYGGNSYYRGYLANYSQSGSALSAANTNPSKGASYKYLRMNYNPCYVGYANMLTMKCDKNCDSFVANPYYMIEPTADLVKIYEMCNALYPIYDTKNVSNFIFVPLEWAYNMFQDWTGNTNCAAKSGSGRNSSGKDDGATLSRPSKTASGRKKAVILLVNKPDWFEPGEMTYLGFNNDKSEVPTVLSDKIDFSINYTDTSKTYLDGSSYNTNHTSGDYSGINNTAFIAAGPNKVIRCTVSSGSVARNSNAGNYYTSAGTSKIRLTFPCKGLFQIKVAPFGSIQFFNTNGLADNINTYYIDGTRTFSFAGGTTGVPNAHTSGGTNFGHNLSVYKVRYATTNAFISDATLTNQFLRDYIGQYARDNSGYKQLILSTGALATRGNSSTSAPYCIAGTYGYVNTYHAGDSDFNTVVSYLPRFRDPCVHAYNSAHIRNDNTYGTEYRDDGYATNDQYYYFGGLTGSYTGYIHGSGTLKFGGTTRSNDTAFTLTDTAPFTLHKISATTALQEVYIKSSLTKRLASVNIADYSKILEDNGGIYLMNLTSNLSTSIVAGKYICFNGDGALSVTSTAQGMLKFTAGAKNDTAAHTFTDEMIYTILPDDLNATADGEYYVDVELTGVKLISAEISNRPYTTAQVLKPISITYNDVEFIAGHQSGATLSWGARQIKTAGTKQWGSVETIYKGLEYTIKDCDTLPTRAIKSNGKLTFQELSRGGSATLPSSADWRSVCYGGDKFVSVALGSNKAAYSTTGTGKWSAATLPSSDNWYLVCYGGGKFVSVARNSNKAAYSTTGTGTWSAATLPSSDWWYSVCYGGGKFVSVALGSKAAYSTDGINWLGSDCQLSFTQKGKISITTTGSGTITFKSGVTGTTSYSVSGTKTTEIEASRLSGSSLTYFLSDGVLTKEVKLTDDTVTSSQTVTTTTKSTITGCNNLSTTESATVGHLTFKELSRGGSATLPSSAKWYSVCYGGDKFVSVAENSNKAAYSTTGTGTWSAATLPSSASWYSVCYGGGKFVSVANGSNKAAYSTTGTGTWSAATLPSSAGWRSVCYGGGKFVSVAESSNKAAYSTDGINWLGSDCQLSFTQKGKIVITTTGSGTMTFKSGVSGMGTPSVTGTSTTTINASQLTGSSLNYFLSDGVYTTKAELTNETSETVSPSQETVDTTVTVNVTDTTDKLCLKSNSNTALTWAIADSSGTVTKANITPTSLDNGRYYYDVTNGYTPKYAMRSAGTITEEAYDLLDFINSSSPTAKNGVLGVVGLEGTVVDTLYTVTSASGAKITANKLGMIELVVAPSMTAANGGTIRLLHGSDTAQKTITEKTTIRIPANDMQMSGTPPSATYYMDFDCTNLVILRAKFMRWQPIFSKPTVPSLSSVIDYSQGSSSKPSYNSNLVFTQQVNAIYDGKLGYWRLTGGSHCIVDMQKYAKNDLFFFTEEYNPTGASVAKPIWYGNGTQKSYASRVTMYLPGMVGMFFKGTEYWPGFGHGGSGNHKMIYAGCTQPINAALYNYAKGTTTANLDSYVSPSTDFNRATLKTLTTAACAKLKTDYGSNVRVYVVKYRKQTKYNSISSSAVTEYGNLRSSNTWTDTPTNHSYTEVDNCASTTGGTAYDVTTEADLKAKLDDIAAKIKSWAEYSEAKNVITE